MNAIDPKDLHEMAEGNLSNYVRDHIHAAADEIEALRKDAERYRWLRDDGDGPANAIAAAVAEGDNEHGGEYVSWLYGDELDAAIDAAMKGANK